MIDVKILDKNINEYMEIVNHLRDNGYVQGIDFDFTYHPPKFDNYSGDAVYNRSVVFTFYKNELATWFSLRYT